MGAEEPGQARMERRAASQIMIIRNRKDTLYRLFQRVTISEPNVCFQIENIGVCGDHERSFFF
jgi:hypothetical protein